MRVIGISAHFHDAACCYLRDGELLWAAEEERFSRQKHDPKLPWRAFRKCLEDNDLAITDIDCVAYYEDPLKKLSRQIWMTQQPDVPESRKRILASLRNVGRVERELREGLGYEGMVKTFEHHQSHAASAFCYSGFEESAILTVDGVGEWATTTLGRGEGGRIEIFEEVAFPNSVGLFYNAVTAYLGFEVNEGEYKVMGLAPYGEPRYVDRVWKLIRSHRDGEFRLALEHFDFLKGDRMYAASWTELLGAPPREPESELEQHHMDVARSVQVVLEEILLEKARYLHRRAPSDNLCMAGGVALNVVANGRILREGRFKRLFVQPAAGDSGTALGAAALAHIELTGRPLTRRLESVNLGPSYDDEAAKFVRASGVSALDFRNDEAGLVEAVVDRLERGSVIAWMQGRMEFGPRALGSRSILADPRREEMRDRINALVKKREAFRPFAPAVLWEEAPRHFELDHPSPFMLETCQVASELTLPAITHVDGSARVQTVDARHGGRFYLLLRAFHRRTGCPILLNTSFNMRGEPIVCTPVDAFTCFVRSQIDTLVLDDFIIDRDAIPARLEKYIRRPELSGSATAVSNKVYALF